MLSNLFHDIPGGVKLVIINIGNFNRKIADMKNDDIFQNADIISLNEAHLGHSDTETPDMIGINKDMVHSSLWPQQQGRWGYSDCKHKAKFWKLCVVEMNEPIQMIVISVYRPLSTPSDVCMNHMLEIIAQFQHVPTCIVGDFNEDVSITLNMHWCAMFRLQGLKQMINKPTHDSGTIIDHVYVSQTVNTMQTDVTDCYYSDHDCILYLITV